MGVDDEERFFLAEYMRQGHGFAAFPDAWYCFAHYAGFGVL